MSLLLQTWQASDPPMAPALLLFFSTIWAALSLPPTLAAAANGQEGGEPCPPVPCGSVTIRIPFGIVPKQAIVMKCGAIGFQVVCNSDTPYLGHSERAHGFQILDIFYDNGSLMIADVHKLQDFNLSGSRGCHVPMDNSSSKLGYPFSISRLNQNLIFYNCTKAPAMAESGSLEETTCGHNTFVRVAEKYEESGNYSDYFLAGCNATVVPVFGGSGKTNASSYKELISDGFLLTWELPPPLPRPMSSSSLLTKDSKSV